MFVLKKIGSVKVKNGLLQDRLYSQALCFIKQIEINLKTELDNGTCCPNIKLYIKAKSLILYENKHKF